MPKITEAIKRIRQELEKLKEEHSEATRRAVYFGMTHEQAKEHDERREKIAKLYEKLASLQKSQGS